MRMSIRLGVFVAAILAATSARSADLCHDPRIPAPQQVPAPKQEQCETYTLPFWDGKSEQTVSIAKITVGWVWDYDVGYPQYEQFLQLPGGEIESLGPFPQENSFKADMFLFEKLGISPAYAGGSAGFKYALIYARRLERIGGLYCLTYQMKLPFQGTYSDCGGRTVISDKFGYVDGAVSWRDAIGKACARTAADTGRKCANNDVDPLFNDLEQDANGVVFYGVALRRRVSPPSTGPGPVDYDYFIYRVELMGGAVTLLKQMTKSPNPHGWINQ